MKMNCSESGIRINIATRMPIWKVLSELFLDTELQESDYKYIANIILKTNYTPLEVHDILWNEVFPVVGVNFSSPIGEWTGFDENWLKVKITNYVAGIEKGYWENGFISVKEAKKIISNEWINICEYLPEVYAYETKAPRK